jgi:signal transduction histidine kinase
VPNARIQIVEDETIVAMDIEDELTTLGYTVTAIGSSGEEAIQQAVETKPDLILMDIRLKGEVDGIEAAEEIRARFNIPVVYLTAYADDDTLARAKITEPFGYIIKPFQERDLHTTIEMALYKHRMEKKLQAYATELEQQNRELDTFAHTVANNLNSLAKMVTNQANTLQSNVRLPDEYQQSLDTIARSGRKMNHVIQELLLLAKVRQTDVTFKRVNMARIVAQAQQRLTEMIEEYQAKIILPGHWPEVLGYGPWIEEIWVGYLSYGIQYGGRPPQLRIGATIQSNRQVRFWIRDNGPGLIPQEQDRLFTSPDQSGQAQERWLRLSIVRHIVEKLGGQVSIDSEGIPGQGIVFSFTLPSPPQ